jgi:hypothetical protein
LKERPKLGPAVRKKRKETKSMPFLKEIPNTSRDQKEKMKLTKRNKTWKKRCLPIVKTESVLTSTSFVFTFQELLDNSFRISIFLRVFLFCFGS